jgi:5-(carboxyamino)imidazole ribonucleotide mutase
MPNDIPVAKVALNAAKNAGILAVEILSVGNKDCQKSILEYRNNLTQSVQGKMDRMIRNGYKAILEEKKKDR